MAHSSAPPGGVARPDGDEAPNARAGNIDFKCGKVRAVKSKLAEWSKGKDGNRIDDNIHLKAVEEASKVVLYHMWLAVGCWLFGYSVWRQRPSRERSAQIRQSHGPRRVS